MKINLTKQSTWMYAGVLLVTVFLVLLVILHTQETTLFYESPILLGFLNTFFLCVMPLSMAYLAAKSHQSTSVTGFLVAGCGFVFFGVSSFFAGWVMPLAGGPNPTVTLHNLGSLFAGICQLLGAHFFLQDVMGLKYVRSRIPGYKILYIGIFALVSITAVLAYQGGLPVFFDPLTGPSALRQFVLGGAISLFAVAGLAFVEIYSTTKTTFAYWYGLALWLIAIGLTGLLLQHGEGSPLGWAGRTAQYVAGIFFIAAFLQGRWERSQTGDRVSSIKSNWPLWPYLEQRFEERTSVLDQANQALQLEISERQRADKTLQGIIDNNPMAMQIVDNDGFTLTVNPAHTRLFGSIPPATYSIFSSFRNKPKEFGDLLQRVMDHGEVVHFPDVYSNAHDTNPDVPDTPVWIRTTCFPLNDEHEKLERLVFTYENITEHKQAELRIVYLMRLYATLSQVNQMIVRVSDQQELFDEICQLAIKFGEFRLAWIGLFDAESGRVNPVAVSGCEEVELPFAEIKATEMPFKQGLVGLAIRSGQVQYSHDIHIDPLMAHWRAAAIKDKYRSAAVIPLRQSGQVIGLLNLYAPDVDFFTAIDEQNLLTEMGMDISFALDNLQRETERKRAEMQLVNTTERLNLATHAGRLGIWDWNIQKDELIWDDRMLELYGINTDSFVGAYEAWLKGVHPDDRALSDEVSRQALSGEKEYDTEFRILWPDGSVHWLKAIGQVFRDEAGNPTRMVGVNYDISEHKQAEKDLRDSEERFAKAFEFAPIGKALVLPGGHWLKVNRSVCNMLGYSEQELLSTTFQALTYPDDLNADLEYMEQILRGELATYEMEKRYIHKSGRLVWALLSVSLIRDEQDNPQYFISQLVDITERKRVEETLRESELKFSTLFQKAAFAASLSKLPDGVLVDVNETFERMFGYAKQEALGKTSLELGINPDAEDRKRIINAVKEHGSARNQIMTLKTKSNEVRTFLVNVDLVEIGGQKHMLNTTLDITERKRAEDAMLESEAQLKFSQRVAHVGHWVWDTITNQVMWSDEMKRIFGVDPVAFNGDMDKIIAEAIHPDDREKVNASNGSVLSEQKPVPLEYRVIWPDASVHTIWAEAGERKLDDQGKIIQLSGIVQDISERKKAEEKIERSLAEKEALLRELYHRTKNNMAVIVALLGLQADAIDDDRLKTEFAEAQNRIRSMSLVHQKLYDAQDLSHINLKDYINDLVDLMLKSYAISPARISVISDMEDVFVLIDSAIPCGLVLNELISNALKYAFTDERSGEIRIRLRKTEQIEFDIADNGVGVPAGFDFRRDGHLGIQTVFMLVENQLQGRVIFDTRQGVACQVMFQDIYYQPRV